MPTFPPSTTKDSLHVVIPEVRRLVGEGVRDVAQDVPALTEGHRHLPVRYLETKRKTALFTIVRVLARDL